jgi:hypothetical protein
MLPTGLLAVLPTGLLVVLPTGLLAVPLPCLDPPTSSSPGAVEPLESESATATAPPVAPKRRPVESTQTPAAKRKYDATDATTISPTRKRTVGRFYVAIRRAGGSSDIPILLWISRGYRRLRLSDLTLPGPPVRILVRMKRSDGDRAADGCPREGCPRTDTLVQISLAALPPDMTVLLDDEPAGPMLAVPVGRHTIRLIKTEIRQR